MTDERAKDASASESWALSLQETQHFDAIAAFAHKRAGLVFHRDKAPMVLARLSKRMRALNIRSLAEYREILESRDAEEERRNLIYTLTTNVTSFMRESHHFKTLGDTLLPPLLAQAKQGGRVRIWSAACSSGQEAYSIAMTILTAAPNAASLDIKVLATDIDVGVLEKARIGIYRTADCDGLSSEMRERFMEPAKEDGSAGPSLRIRDCVRSLITFRELNLLDEWPMRGKFDVIFCRNVIIYFDRPTQHLLWEKFDNILKEDGHLLIGHSERVDTTQFPQFKPSGTTIYQRVGKRSPAYEGI